MIVRLLQAVLALYLMALPGLAEIRIQEVTSAGGIKAWLVEDHNIPFAALEVRFRGGTSLDPAGKRGAVNLMTALIEEGAGEMDAQGFAKARDALAAEFRFDSDLDGIGVSARFLTENRDAALALLQDALTRPRFDADAVERVRGQVLSGLRSQAEDPDSLASQALMARAFGAHPYGSDGSGTADSVTALTREDIVAAWKGALTRDGVLVAVAGDISAAELGPMLDRLLGGLPETGLARPGRVELNAKGGLAQIAFPGPQSTIRFYQGGIRFEDPDYFAAAVLNEILGGSRFNARLMQEVREKRGLTYGIGTSLVALDHGEMLTGHLATGNDTAAAAIEVVRAQWADLAANGVTEAELEAARTFMIGSYPLRFDGNGRIASILVGMQLLGLPVDYPAQRGARIAAVTIDDVKRVAAKLLQPDRLFFEVVGGAVGLTATE